MKVAIQLVDDDGNVFAGEVVLQRVSSNGDAEIPKAAKPEERASGKVSCSSAVEGLWKTGKFKQALSFQDVKTALAEDGYNFPQNTVMMALQSGAYLTRRGGRGSYTWTQKYPFNS